MAGVASAVAARRAMGRRVPKIIATRSPLSTPLSLFSGTLNKETFLEHLFQLPELAYISKCACGAKQIPEMLGKMYTTGASPRYGK
jgi:hypothetical protein